MKTKEASKYYLAYQGLPTTKKRIEKLISQFNEDIIVRMATERGFKYSENK